MIFDGNTRWLEWLRSYELHDPEPPMTIDRTGAYPMTQTITHMEWHRRMTNACMREQFHG